MRIAIALASAGLLLFLGACGTSEPPTPAPTGPVVASLDTLPATVEGTLFFDLEGGAKGDGAQTHATLQFGEDALSVRMPTALAHLLDVPDDGARVRVTIGSEVVEDGDSTLVITAAQRL